MNLQGHIDELSKRRDALKTEISKEVASPGVDPLRVSTLKRRNLWLKDTIERLRAA